MTELPKNQVGSPFFEIDLSSSEEWQKLSVYAGEVNRRNSEWLDEHVRWDAPETLIGGGPYSVE